MEHMIQLHIEKLPEGVYLATSDDVQGLIAQGRTLQEGALRAILKQADVDAETFLRKKSLSALLHWNINGPSLNILPNRRPASADFSSNGICRAN